MKEDNYPFAVPQKMVPPSVWNVVNMDNGCRGCKNCTCGIKKEVRQMEISEVEEIRMADERARQELQKFWEKQPFPGLGVKTC